MNTNKLTIYLALVVCVATLAACSTETSDTSGPPSSPASRLPVDVTIAKESKLTQEETIAASILPLREVTIMSEVTKKVSDILFKDGAFVHAGQILYRLEGTDIQARLKQVRAELALAEMNEKRFSQLLRTESIRQEEYDVAATRLQSLQASEEILQVELDKTVIRAPFSGVIGITKVQTGSLVSPGMPLVTLMEQGKVKITFNVSEKYVGYLRPGKLVQFSTSNSSEKYHATIHATESGLDMQSRTITVNAVAENRNHLLKPGMAAKVYLAVADDGDKAIMLPTESLIPAQGGYNVFTVKNGLAKMQAVTIGGRNESEALITSGLHNGDTVMISNVLRSTDGTPVEIISTK